jgi:hypothetical protein
MKLEGVEAGQIETALRTILDRGDLKLEGKLEATAANAFVYSRT